jgi:hypothetical protein
MLGKLDQLSIKYFKLAISEYKLKKDTGTELQCCCPVCGDTKNRLHLYRPKGFDQDVVHCFNSGCLLEEKHHNIINFLKIVKPDLVDAYKRENLNTMISTFSGSSPSKSGRSDVQDILSTIEKNTGITETNKNKKRLEIPLDKLFMKCKDSEACKAYVKHRGFQPQDDWYFSENEFFTYNKKKVYLKDYLIIPIYSNNKYRGFYSRSIKEKSFSTFLLPDTEKVWVSSPETTPENLEILTEGVFDALSTGFEHSGAMLSASVSEEFLTKLNPECIIALDNDSTGIKRSIEYAEKGFKVFVWPRDDYKDFNDMLTDFKKNEINAMIRVGAEKGISAIAKLKMKEI